MWLGGLHRCNEWAGRTGRSGFSCGLLWTGADAVDAAEYGILDGADWGGRADGGTTEFWTGQTRADAADAADYGILDGAD